MEITVQITVKSPAGEPELIQQVAHLQRGALQPDTLGLSLADTVPLLASFLSIPLDDRYAPLQMSPDLYRQRLLATLVEILVRLSQQRPTLLVVEDLHWSDTSTIELLDRLLAQVSSLRLMVVLTARPEFQSPWPPVRTSTP